MIDGIIKGQILIASEVRGGRWGGSTTLNVDELDEFRKENSQYNIIKGWEKCY